MTKSIYELPIFLSNNEIYSDLKGFLDAIDDHQYEGFKNLYHIDQNLFFSIVNEMALRGIKFNIEDDIFPKVNYDASNYIECIDFEGNNYRKIKFMNMGIENILYDFNIENDGFFHKIPLAGFKFLNSKIDLGYVKKQFTKAGFIIKDCKGNIINDNLLFVDQHLITYHYRNMKYNEFKYYCELNGYVLMEDLNEDILRELINIEGFDSIIVDDILKKYNKWMNKKNEVNKIPKKRGPKKKTKEIEIPFDYPKYKIKIELIFFDIYFSRFLNYCRQNNIEYVYDLNEELLTNYFTQWGVRSKKINEIKHVLLKLSESKIYENEIFYFDSYDELIPFNISINEYFDLFEIKAKTSKEIYLQDIINKKYIDLESICCIDDLKQLQFYLRKYHKIEIFFNEIIDHLMKSEKYKVVILDRLNGNQTLEKLAIKLGLTRERIRQIEVRLIKIIGRTLDNIMFSSYLKLLLWDKQIISKKDMIELFPQYSKLLIRIINEGMTSLSWNDQYKFYSFDKIELIQPPILHEEWDYCLTKDIISACMKYWSNTIVDLDQDKIETILSKAYHLNIHKEIITRKYFTKEKCIEALLRYYYTDGIRFDIDGCHEIRKKALERFDCDLSELSDRSIDAKARNNDNLILVDSKKFKYYYENEGLLLLKDKVEKYIDQYFEIHDQINSFILYDTFKKECNDNGLYSNVGLYSLMKRYCIDKYTFSKGNEKEIYKSIDSRIMRNDVLLKLFSFDQPVLKKKEIIKELYWKEYKLNNTINESKEFYIGSLSKIYCKKYIHLNEDEEKIIIDTYNDCMENGYCHLNKVYNMLKDDIRIHHILKKYNIENGTDIGVLLPEKLNVKVIHSIAHLKDIEKRSIVEILMLKFPSIVSRQEIYDYLKNNGYDYSKIAHILGKVDDGDGFIHLSRDCFVNAEDFEISKDVVDQLLEYIGDQEYVLLNALKGYKEVLPKIKYEWTPMLMMEILIQNGYRLLLRYSRDYRFDYCIVVKNSSNMITLTDLVYHILRFEYKGKHDVQDIVEYMNDRKVYHNKTILTEILQDDRFYLDELNHLYWKE